MNIIDFHSHILPGMDDGSRNGEMSERMLELYAEQGINVIVATPHFYADRMTLESFLDKRAAAYEYLQSQAGFRGIRLIPGAEVAFFAGMGDADGMEKLTVGGTSLLLLEMPFRPWNRADIREVEKLANRGIIPVMAHIERFFPYQRDKRIFDELYALPVFCQLNAEALMGWRTAHLALRLLREGRIHLLGSDCHNTDSRPPNLKKGREIIRKKLGDPHCARIDRFGGEVLGLS